MNLDYIFTEVCTQMSSQKYDTIGWQKALAQTRWLGIISSYVGLVHWHKYVSLGRDELMFRNNTDI